MPVDTPRPTFFEDSGTDRLVAIVAALSAEVAALIGRLDTIETLAGRKGLLTSEEIEAYEPTDEEFARRTARQQAFVERVYYILAEETASLNDKGSR